MCPPNPVYPAGLFSEAFLHREHGPPFQADQPVYSKSLMNVIKALVDCSQDINPPPPLLNLLSVQDWSTAEGFLCEDWGPALPEGPGHLCTQCPGHFWCPRSRSSGSRSQTELPPTPLVFTGPNGLSLNIPTHASLLGIFLLPLCPGKQG